MAIRGIEPLLEVARNPVVIAVAVPAALAAIYYLGRKQPEPTAIDRCYVEISLHGDAMGSDSKVLLISKTIYEKMQLKPGQAVILGAIAFKPQIQEALPPKAVSMHHDYLKVVSSFLSSSKMYGTLLMAARDVAVLDEMMLISNHSDISDGSTSFIDGKRYGVLLKRSFAGRIYWRDEELSAKIEGVDYVFRASNIEHTCFIPSATCRLRFELANHKSFPNRWTMTNQASLFFEIDYLAHDCFYKETVIDELERMRHSSQMPELVPGMVLNNECFWSVGDKVEIRGGEIQATLCRIVDEEGNECEIAPCNGIPKVHCDDERLLERTPISLEDAIQKMNLVLPSQMLPKLEFVYQELQKGELLGHVLITGPTGCGKHLLVRALTLDVPSKKDVRFVGPADLVTPEGILAPVKLKELAEESSKLVLVLQSADYLFEAEEASPMHCQLRQLFKTDSFCVMAVCEKAPSPDIVAKFAHHIEFSLPNKEMRSDLIGIYHRDCLEELVAASDGLSGQQIRYALEGFEDPEVCERRLLQAQRTTHSYFS